MDLCYKQTDQKNDLAFDNSLAYRCVWTAFIKANDSCFVETEIWK